jgi:hypothetical protein
VTERKNRIGIIGLSGSQTVAGVVAMAQGLNSRRLALVWPSSVKMIIPNVGETAVSGVYLAAAIAGVATSANFDVAEPLLRKEPVGFTEITDNLLRSEKNQLGASGVFVIETINGIARVRDDITTAQSGKPEDEEISVVQAIDYVGLNWAKILEAIYVGTKLLSETPSLIKTTSKVILENFVQQRIINGYQAITAKQNSIAPSQIDVSAEIRFIFSTKWIYIPFTLTV